MNDPYARHVYIATAPILVSSSPNSLFNVKNFIPIFEMDFTYLYLHIGDDPDNYNSTTATVAPDKNQTINCLCQSVSHHCVFKDPSKEISW